MVHQQLQVIPSKSDTIEDGIIQTIELVLEQYLVWQQAQRRIRAQIAFDFRLSGPSVDQAGDIMHRFILLADVLRWLADQITSEVEDTTDQWVTWQID
jgi:hypothetical protein